MSGPYDWEQADKQVGERLRAFEEKLSDLHGEIVDSAEHLDEYLVEMGGGKSCKWTKEQIVEEAQYIAVKAAEFAKILREGI